jgi:hypothetical protein
MTDEESVALEAFWAKQLLECRKNLVAHVRQAMSTSSPTRRREMYQGWRMDHGDDLARSYALYSEACIAGRVRIEPIEKMLGEHHGK